MSGHFHPSSASGSAHVSSTHNMFHLLNLLQFFQLCPMDWSSPSSPGLDSGHGGTDDFCIVSRYVRTFSSFISLELSTGQLYLQHVSSIESIVIFLCFSNRPELPSSPMVWIPAMGALRIFSLLPGYVWELHQPQAHQLMSALHFSHGLDFHSLVNAVVCKVNGSLCQVFQWSHVLPGALVVWSKKTWWNTFVTDLNAI